MALLLASGLCGCLPPPAPGHCRAAPDNLNFGQVELNAGVKTQKVRLWNSLDTAQRLTASPLSHPFRVEPAGPVTLAANNGFAELFVSFGPADARLHLGELLLVSDDGACDLTVPLRGLGAGSLRADPPVLEFDLNAGETQTKEVRIDNTRRVPLELDFELMGPASIVLPVERTIAPGGTLFVKVKATLDGWQRSSAVLLVTSELDRLNIPIELIPSSPRVEISPPGFDIPVVGMNLSSMPPGFTERVLRVRNAGTSNDPSAPRLTVEGLTLTRNITADEFIVSRPVTTLGENESMELSIRLIPKSTGPRSFEFQLLSNAGRPVVVPFTARAFILAPCRIEVTPADRLTLQDMADGGLAGTVSFRNPGNTACIVDGVRLSAPPPGAFSIVDSPGEQFRVPPYSVQPLTIAGPGQLDAGTVGALGFHVFRAGSDVRWISVEAP